MRENQIVPEHGVHVRERQTTRANVLLVADDIQFKRENPLHASCILLRLVDPENVNIRVAVLQHETPHSPSIMPDAAQTQRVSSGPLHNCQLLEKRFNFSIGQKIVPGRDQ